MVVVLIVPGLTAFGSRWVHGRFPARPFANIVDVTVTGLQPAGVVEIPVLSEHFLSNPLQDLVAGHPRRDSLQTEGLAAHVTLVKAQYRGLPAIARAGDEEGVPRLLTARATCFFVQANTFGRYYLGSIILNVWLNLALLASSLVTLLIHAFSSMESRRACSSPSFQSSTLRRKRVYCPQKSRQSRRRISRPSC